LRLRQWRKFRRTEQQDVLNLRIAPILAGALSLVVGRISNHEAFSRNRSERFPLVEMFPFDEQTSVVFKAMPG
jgi:hypothetical protein